MKSTLNLLRRKSSSNMALSIDASANALPSPSPLVEMAKTATSMTEADRSLLLALAMSAEQSSESDLDLLAAFLSDRLKSKRHTVVMISLMALEALFLECTMRVHARMAIDRVVEAVVALTEKLKKPARDNVEEANKALDLVRSWGEGFRTQHDYGAGASIVAAYKDLQKQHWIVWPPKQTPVFNPMRFAPELTPGGHEKKLSPFDSPKPQKPRKPASLRPSSAKLFGSTEAATFRREFDGFDLTITAFETELDACSDYESLKANTTVNELALTCHRITPQLASIIEILTSTVKDPEEVLQPFLVMNDRLNVLLARHKKLSQKSEYNALAEFGADAGTAAPSNPFDDNKLFAPPMERSVSLNPFDDDDGIL